MNEWDVWLQVWGGAGYLLNKIFFSFAERAKRKTLPDQARGWRIASWSVYLAGLPAWIIIFVQWKTWIAAALEVAGVPSMALGLWVAVRRSESAPPQWLNQVAILGIAIGFTVSVLDFGGITQLSQWLEIALVGGFLIGTYQLARNWPQGYLWYILMHIACGWLMWIQGYPWLLLQQAVSLAFIIDAYCSAQTRQV